VIEAHDGWGGCENTEPDMECEPRRHCCRLQTVFVVDIHGLCRYTNTYYRTGYCHQLLDWSAEERATVAGALRLLAVRPF
jgi:hypothetical protein